MPSARAGQSVIFSLLLSVALAAPAGVSQREAEFGFNQMVKSLRASGVSASEVKMPSQPTRGSIILAFNQLATATIEEAQYFPPPPPEGPKALTTGLNANEQQALARLVRWQLVDSNAWIVVRSDVPPPGELGRIMGAFLARAAELVHEPHPKYSPYLAKP